MVLSDMTTMKIFSISIVLKLVLEFKYIYYIIYWMNSHAENDWNIISPIPFYMSNFLLSNQKFFHFYIYSINESEIMHHIFVSFELNLLFQLRSTELFFHWVFVLFIDLFFIIIIFNFSHLCNCCQLTIFGIYMIPSWIFSQCNIVEKLHWMTCFANFFHYQIVSLFELFRIIGV